MVGFGFVYGGERETGEEGTKKLERGDYFFWLYILVDNIYYFRHKCIFSPYIFTFFHFSPYILFLSLLVPKPINAPHLSP